LGYAFKNNTDGYLYTLKIGDLNTQNFEGEVLKDVIGKIKRIPDFLDLFYYEPDYTTIKIEDEQFDLGADVSYEWDFLLADNMPPWAIEDKVKPGIMLFRYIKGKEDKIIYGLREDELIPKIKSFNDVGVRKELKISDYLSSEEFGTNDEIIERDELFYNFSHLYWYTSIKMKSFKKATQFFKNMGIDAFVVYRSLKGDEYFLNLINPDKIDNINKEEVKYDEHKDYLDLDNM